MADKNVNMEGLSTAQVIQLQKQFGRNELTPQKKVGFLRKALCVICEPMFLLLLAAAVIYFVLGEPGDGAVMLIFVIGMISIDVMQEWKTDRTLNALKELSAPHVQVIRNGTRQQIASVDLVPGDLMLICEGVKIPADGIVVKCSSLCVDESSLTGEAESVWKVSREQAEPSNDYWRKDFCYAGTLVIQGTATVQVETIGAATEYGKIGAGIAESPDVTTPLQKQTKNLVTLCAGIAMALFVMVCLFTYLNLPDIKVTDRLIESILAGVTLAMAMIPEEFPVILTVFLSMGAWRLAKKSSLVRRLPSVETLGAVSVLCVDKTGTITMNHMTVQEIWSADGKDATLCETMGLGCESEAYDPMEKAMLNHCEKLGIPKEHLFAGELITEYAFTNELKMMGHVWFHDGELVIAVKGSPEKVLTLCELTEDDKKAAKEKCHEMFERGLRVIAIGMMKPESREEIPDTLEACSLQFLGLAGLADPPRTGMKEAIAACKKAGIRLVMITGDNGVTAASVAGQIGIPCGSHVITGDELDRMTEEELREEIQEVSIFSRVVPSHKMRIVRAFKDNGEIVAMTGDGVNDAPALKCADIGIAMGKRGSEVSREAADLILMDDNFTTIVETVKDGRRIYDNIRKAVGYVFTIHIPIALASLLGPILGIASVNLLLLPIHIVLMELLIDPTCSVVLERQPAEIDIMERKPRDPRERLITSSGLAKSVIQGLVIFSVSFGAYMWRLASDGNVPVARSMGLSILMLSNLFLVQVNSSDHDFAIVSALRLAKDRVMWAANIGTLAMLIIILYSPLNSFLKLAPLSAMDAVTTMLFAVVAVFWYELVKLIRFVVK